MESPDLVPPVMQGHADGIRTEWLRHLPKEVFGPRRATVAVSFRVDEQGNVTSACVERGVRDVVNEAMRRSLLTLRFTAATRAGLPVPVLIRREINLIRPEGYFAADVSADATDESWLERIAVNPASDTRIAQSPILNRLYRDIRVHAFARLGELGSPRALAAIERIERRVAGVVQTPTFVSSHQYSHPSLNFGDDPAQAIAEVDLPGGRVRVLAEPLLGSRDVFVATNETPGDDSTWTRPLLTTVKWPATMQGASLTVVSERRLLLAVAQQEHVLDLAEIRRDSDGDGWTDLEEARLGLRPDRRDSDGDGRDDGRDVCPLLPIGSETVHGEEREILRRALFAVFAVGGSRHLLLVDPPSAKFHLDGYGGPVLYDVDAKTWAARHGSVGVRIAWRVLARTAREAAVEVRDYEGRLAAGTQNVYLRKVGARWVVVGRVPTSVS